jgi:hypothetical protein
MVCSIIPPISAPSIKLWSVRKGNATIGGRNMAEWWTMLSGPEREAAKAAYYEAQPADNEEAKPTYSKFKGVTLITFPGGRQAYQRRRGEAVFMFRSEAEAELQYRFCTSGLPPCPHIFNYTQRDGELIAVARSGREYILWGDNVLPRLRRIQLDAFCEAEAELRRTVGRPRQPYIITEEQQQ